MAGSNVVTGLAGLKWKPSGHLEVGGGYEFPLTQNHDILSNRALFRRDSPLLSGGDTVTGRPHCLRSFPNAQFRRRGWRCVGKDST